MTFADNLGELEIEVKKGLYDISIIHQEPPQSLEFEVKKGCMELDELCELILSVCNKYDKKENVVLESYLKKQSRS